MSLSLDSSPLQFAAEPLAHWREARTPGDPVPSRDRIDPARMRGALPWLMIHGVSDPTRSIVRLAGTAYRERFGRDITGEDWRNHIPPALGAFAELTSRRAFPHPCGVWFRGGRDEPSGAPELVIEAVLLPLRPTAAAPPTMVLMYSVDRWAREALRAAAGGDAQVRRLTRFESDLIDLGCGVPDDLSRVRFG